MSLDGIAEKAASIQFDESKAEEQTKGVDSDAHTPARIPLKIDDGIIVRSLTNATHMAKCKIIGAMHGKFILITAPAVQINERIAAILDGDFLCSYFTDGKLYSFHSRYRRDLINDTVCIEYPKEVQVRQIRKDRRVRVNIETECVLCAMGDCFSADMIDISSGGCRLVFNQDAGITKGSNVSLTFNMPDGAFVSQLQAVVVRANSVKSSNTAEVGLLFTGPASEISKISNFCEFCMFFDLE